MGVYKLKPIIKSYIWGGQYFRSFKCDFEGDNLAECWELSLRENNSSIIDSGINKGKTLLEVIKKEDIGPVADYFPFFPLLIKLIDAAQDLSVQVHPDDEYALKNEHSFGKGEMWYIISADEGSGVYLGLNKDYQKEEIVELLNNNRILDALNFIKVKPGDTFMINPGTIHAIGKGVRLIEIQQNSDITYRLYDYNRVDKNGLPRELHICKALEVIDLKKYKPIIPQGDFLIKNQFFTVKRIELDGEINLEANQDSFISFTFISGSAAGEEIVFNTFETGFIPYHQSLKLKGKGTTIVSSVDQNKKPKF